MLIIGLAGGIGSGKSFVANQFALLGAGVIDADQIGHEVLKRPDTIRSLVEWFGNEILNDQLEIDSRLEIDRRRLATIVFSPTPEGAVALNQLESITHPQITTEVNDRLRRGRENGIPAMILDAAVMFKSGWDQWCDRLVFVMASPETRWLRVAQRGWSRDQWQAREASQLDLSEKQRRSTDLISNNGDETESVPEQVLRLWRKWGLSDEIQSQISDF